MRFDILSLFPEALEPYIRSSILKRAGDKGIFEWALHDIRKHAVDEYGHVDDTLYGGGTGMLMLAEPLYRSWQDAVTAGGTLAKSSRRTIYLSPKGRTFTQNIAREYADCDQLILICGHYEGIDQRLIDEIVDEELSIGDYVLTGGELAALVVLDGTSRMLEGVLPDKSAYENESHFEGRLEARQYTRPPEWYGRKVPPVLMGGHHGLIEDFRRLDGLNETLLKRPDLFDKLELSPEEIEQLIQYRASFVNNDKTGVLTRE
ncbi:MAG: tRNA (guanosine(37)-N1)-methyltransferase TrmD [Clostridia bacterium]|nr:tRNA (guanosine(37)-N1)-methyltransferase TrmD [Clostridia bacterium]